ncbi:triacylglycerol lipase 1 [Morus notabilis]|uniref:triacylglycerol lipase 1 n=1 Tax=Morus notabilis TaxID=981085 RepID=UPI000CED28A1|nr:triacylglycerol lipase 1 [Morus notabilis]XP_024021285.1 triacylglycerol lipase 1 [Morus notabilis]XP_024021286.1 triacylglycerol lipase 1 [Morus notabilis]
MATSVAVTTTAMMMIISFFLSLFASIIAGESSLNFSGYHYFDGPSDSASLCSQLVQPAGYPCSEHTAVTDDGYVLALQRVSTSTGNLRQNPGPPVLLQHGLFMGGDAWFLNPPEESLGFILADQGFDVWVGNVRGTRWSHGHVSLSVKDKVFWDWSWQELALHDLPAMLCYINSVTNSKVFYVGHSLGTIMGLAAFTQPDINIGDMVEAASLLSPIAYLGHASAGLVLRLVNMHLDEIILAMGIHELNLRSAWCINLIDAICDAHIDCNDLLSSITGKNCCFNNSRVNFYLEYEPHPSSTKNVNHLFQMIRKGAFSMYDYGLLKNLVHYGQLNPPQFKLGHIPKTLPLWIAYGGNDALGDVTDVEYTVRKLKSKPELLYLENYGHVDFIVSVNAKKDVYEPMISFFQSRAKASSLK